MEVDDNNCTMLLEEILEHILTFMSKTSRNSFALASKQFYRLACSFEEKLVINEELVSSYQ
jgi:hypothetical protein